MKTLKDIRTSTGRGSKLLKNKVSLGERKSFLSRKRVERASYSLKDRVVYNRRAGPDWGRVISRRIYQLEEEIKEMRSFAREGINGSKKQLKYLEEKLELLKKTRAEILSQDP